MDFFLFIGLPYAAFLILIIGWIYKYFERGFQISSLSSQFLEGNKLFWGSQPFHWGIMVILLGHLIGFLIPNAVIAWNGEPVRLIILEVSALIFAFSALVGVILLIIRRITNKRIRIITSKADLFVYLIIFVQIVTGIYVAIFFRWGSSWYASAMVPYLKSVFLLQPDIAAISQMPFMVKLHVISSFFLIGAIPFTRFSHFMVFPIMYYWRASQRVIWNRYRYTHRISKNIIPRVKPKNN
jgi:nitrate reductase gamma subunit